MMRAISLRSRFVRFFASKSSSKGQDLELSEAKLKRLQEDPSSPVFQQELYQLIKDQAAAVDDADAEYDAAENGEFELEDEVSKIQKRYPVMLKQLDNMLGTSASKHSIDADEAAPLDVDPDLVLRAHVAREGEENVDEQLDALTPADQLRMADMEEAFEWFEAKEEENTPEAVKAEREEQRHRKALQALQRTPFKTYSKGLELFLSSYVEFGDLGYDLNNAARNNEAFSLGSLPEGKYHWTDDRYEDGVILIKVREEKRGEYNDPELAGLGVGPAQGRGVDRICRQGLMIDLGRRKLHAVEYWECGDEDMSEKERWQVFDIPSSWLTALKQVKWPEQWDDKVVRLTFPASAAIIEDAIISAYPLEFGAAASMRF